MSTTRDFPRAGWLKSSYSQGNGGNCVEWAPGSAPSGAVPVRDSKRPDGPTITPSTAAWSAFVDEIRGGGLSAG
nr:DUF397 domain-containing protein [Streptomyces eurocidicus]